MKGNFTFYLTGLDSVTLFLALFSIVGIFTCTGLALVHKYFHSRRSETWQGSRFITSFFTIIGALLGVVLGMVLVTVWQNYQKEKAECCI